MTAIPTFAFPDLDASHLDDRMDVASSPYRPADDIDIDLDSVRDPSVLGSVHDEMFDDAVVPADAATDLQRQLDETFDDDLMFDDTRQDPLEQQDTDYNMEGHGEEMEANEDEDILYEDEEEAPSLPSQNNGTVEYSNNQPQQNYGQVDVDALSAEPAHHPPLEEKDDHGTNNTENLLADSPGTGDRAASGLDQRTLPHEPTPEINEYAPEQIDAHSLRDKETEQDEEPAAHVTPSERIEPNRRSSERGSGAEQPYTDQTNLEANESVEPGETHTLPELQQDLLVETSEAKDATKTVHPVMLYYLEEEMSLFPPMLNDASSVYFLSDSSLAFGPLDQLLAACRDILADTLDHHDELVLDVPGLGLHICEDSKYAAQITLSQILDVYLRLCQNDEGHGAQPLYCHLSSRVSLASQYAYLASAGEEGKTYTEVAADHMDSPEVESSAEAVDQTVGQHDGIFPESESVADHPDEQQTADQAHEGQHRDILDVGDHEQTSSTDAQPDAPEITEEPAVDAPAADADHSEAHAETVASEQYIHQEDAEPAAEREFSDDQAPALESADSESSEVADAAVDNVDNDSNSSHTLEGDATGGGLPTSIADNSEADHAGFYSTTEQAEELFPAEESTLDLPPEYDPFGEDEFFPAHDEEAEVYEQDETGDLTTSSDNSTLAAPSERGLPQSATSFLEDGEHSGQETRPSDSKTNAPISGNLSPPLTPKGAKRKAEDDELLFLDLDTPDPKRRRPS